MAAAIAAAIVACGGADTTSRDSATTSARIAPAPDLGSGAASAPTDSAGRCPATGLWAECSALYRLERAGLAARVDTARVREEPFVIPGLRLDIGGGELVLYLYADTTARAAVGRRLDPERFVPPDGAITHRGERVVIASSNLLGIMKVSNPRNREIIVNALLGGPPQPASETPRP